MEVFFNSERQKTKRGKNKMVVGYIRTSTTLQQNSIEGN